MTETSYFWGGTTVGDATIAPYDDDEYSDIQRKMFTVNRAVQGVLVNYLEELLVQNPSGTTIRLNTGAAIVDGKFYEADADVDFSVTVPGAGSNYYTLVLRKSWVAQTVRAAILGPDVGAPPAVTQTDGTTWEISLATVRVQSSGVITVTDTREYCQFNQLSSTENIEDAAITAAKLDPSLRWVLIDSDTIASDGDTIDWNGIPSTYSHLWIIVGARATATGGGLVDAGLRINFNADAGNNYRSVDHNMSFNEDTAEHNDSGTTTRLRLYGGVNPDSDAAGRFGMVEIFIRSYASTAMIKFAQWHSSIYGASIFDQNLGYGYWNSLAAISRIQISSDENIGSGNYGFKAGSTFSLYGLP